MKKIKITLFVVFIALIGLCVWYFVINPYNKTDILQAIPEKPVFVIETGNSFKTWEKLTSGAVWQNLKDHKFFSEIASGMNMLDTLIQSNELLSRYIGTRPMIVSVHVTGKGDTDFIYALDLQQTAKLLSINEKINEFLSERFDVLTYKYNNKSIFKLVNSETKEILFFYIHSNVLAASYNQKLIQASIDQFEKSGLAADVNFINVRQKISGRGMFQLFINYAKLDDYTNGLLSIPNQNIKQLSKSLYYTGLAFDVEGDNMVCCEGFTNFNDSIPSSFKAMIQSGSGKSDLAEVLPLQTASVVSLGFDRFTLYFDNLMENLKETPLNNDEYQKTIMEVEDFLEIDIRENFMDWIGQEAAMVHLAPMGLGQSNEFAVFLKARDVGDAEENLNFIAQQIKKHTPVKFKQIDYNGHNISFLSVKGFFRVLLGKYFQKLDKPYYTYVGDYVVFSNHPQTLKVIIDGYVQKNLLSKLDEYNSFVNNFSRQSNVFMFVNTEQFIKSLQGMVNTSTWNQIQDNKDNILSFPYFGFQLAKDNMFFETKMYLKFDDPAQKESDNFFNLSGDDTDEIKIVVIDQVTDEVSEILENADRYTPDSPNASLFSERFSNGKLKVEFELKDGFRHGYYKEFYENGNSKIKGEYRNDHKKGLWKIYSENGELLQKIKFDEVKN